MEKEYVLTREYMSDEVRDEIEIELYDSLPKGLTAYHKAIKEEQESDWFTWRQDNNYDININDEYNTGKEWYQWRAEANTTDYIIITLQSKEVK